RKNEREFPFAAEFRFYEELNDFLKPEQRQRTVVYRFDGHPGIKDPIEALGVPHVEVDLIVVNGASVGFDYQLKDGDRVAVYPVFESFDVAPLVKLREKPLRKIAFVVDVNLGRLARLLRLLGFDALFSNAYADDEIVAISEAQGRIVLTRDRRLLYAKAVTHGCWVRSVWPRRQVDEVVRRFDLAGQIRPFSRCADCNGRIEPVAKDAVADRLEPKTKKYYETFYRCPDCGKVYWEGSHVERLRERFKGVL
ncbi:MAG: Mut7-C RNAse domain-containing protein, partial [Kiritimatiellia bacterium]